MIGESGSLRKMMVGSAFFVATCIIAVIGYTSAGWTFVDSVYMVVITIFGVGYGEVQPIEGTGLKVFTAAIIIAGCSSGIYVVGGFVQMIAEGEIQRTLGARRMSRGIEQTSEHVIVCGFGRVGQNLAAELSELNEPFVCVDANPDRIALAEDRGFLVVTGDAGEEETLLRAGIHRARVLATVLPDDSANVFITLTARELSETVEIIARGESMATQRKLIRSGANHVVLPAAIGASRIANMVSCPTAETLISDPKQFGRVNTDLDSLGLNLREVAIDHDTKVAGMKLSDLSIDGGGKMLVVAIRSAEGAIEKNPPENRMLSAGDTLYLVSEKQHAGHLVGKIQSKRPEMVYRGARQ